MRRAPIVALVLLACDAGTPARPTRRPQRAIEDGGRLVARRWIVGAHEVFRDFLDRATGEPCTFTNNVGPGPTYRCLPSSAALHSEGQGPFLDVECTIPAGIVLDRPSDFAIVERKNACTSERAIYRTGPVERRRVYGLDGNACLPRGALPIDVQRLEREIPNVAFVRATPEIEQRGERIVRLDLVSEDGARQPFEAFDTSRNEPVVVDFGNSTGEVGEDAQRWRPSRVAFVGGGAPQFVDSACTVQAATKVGRDAPCPLTAALVFEGICGNHVVHAIGTQVAPKSKVDTFCQEATTRSLAFTVGAPIPVDSFAVATRVEVEALGVKRRGFIGPDDARVIMWGDVLAPVSGEPCTVTRAIDDVDRCLPSLTASAGSFADAECSLPAIRYAATGCDSGTPPKYVRIDARPFLVEAPLEKVFTFEGGSCRAAMLAPNERGYAISEVDAGQFPIAKD